MVFILVNVRDKSLFEVQDVGLFVSFFLFFFVCLFVFGATTPQARTSSLTRFTYRFTYISHNDVPPSIGLLWTSDQFVAETSIWHHTTLTKEKHSGPVGFKPTISTGEWPQTYALDRAATGTGSRCR